MFEEKVAEKLKQFHRDYDLDELASNDRFQLEQLAHALVHRDTYSSMMEAELSLEEPSVTKIKNLQKLLSDSIRDISNLEDGLRISRKNRKEKTESPVDYIKELKERAKRHLENRLSYIYCKCGVLVATFWLLNYDQGSRFMFICPQCGSKFFINDSELKNRTNDENRVVPTRVLGK